MTTASKVVNTLTDKNGNTIQTTMTRTRKGDRYGFIVNNVGGRDVTTGVKINLILARFIGGEKLEDIAKDYGVPVSYVASWLQGMQRQWEADKFNPDGDKVSAVYTTLTTNGLEFPTKKLAFWFRENPAQKQADPAKAKTILGLSGMFSDFAKTASPKKS